jgi:hypothetical protein
MAETVRTLSALLTNLADNTSGDILPEDIRDLAVSTYQLDYSEEVSVTTTATLTIGKRHVCSGTSADYTVTLPSVTGNAGKQLQIRMAPGLTRVVTVDGNGSELVNGVASIPMTANESLLLECDGSGWQSIGMSRELLSGSAVLGSSYTITSSTFQDTGLSIELPTAGTYYIGYNVRSFISTSGGTPVFYIVVQLYDATSAAAIANTERLGVLSDSNNQAQLQASFSSLVTVTQKTTVKLYAKREAVGAPTWSASAIGSDAAGYTVMNYVRIK